MKIKTRYINDNPNRRTKPEEFVYHRGVLLRAIEAERDCSGCYFHNNTIDGCTFNFPESNWLSFYCTYTFEGKTKHLHFEEV